MSGVKRHREKLEDEEGPDDTAQQNEAVHGQAASPRSVLPAPKRLRRELYPKGSVLKVRMHNFMTYGEITFVPGPRLNLILGPNGTGKSSLVCALCVGLGGAPKLLGRSEQMADYVRRGCSDGFTEIHLSGGEGHNAGSIVVMRRIKSDGTSQWKLNGHECTMTAVRDRMDALNVQLNNLCQFLPQDKVSEFARLKPRELLQATEKSMLNGQLLNLHLQLIERKKDLNDQQHRVGTMEAELASLQQLNAGLQRDLARYQEREDLLEQVKKAERKMPWVRFAEAQEKYKRSKEALQAAQRNLSDLKAEVAQAAGPLKELEKQETRLKADKAKLDKERWRLEKVRAEQMDAVIGKTDDLTNAREDLDGLADAKAEHDDKLAAARGALENARQAVTAVPKPAEVDPREKQQLDAEWRDYTTQIRSHQATIDELQHNREGTRRNLNTIMDRLRQRQSVKGQRLAALDQRNRGIADVFKWVHTNADRFKGPVFGPLICEVSVDNPLHASMLEQSVRNEVWTFFVTQHKEDQQLVIATFRDRPSRSYRPNVACYEGDPSEPMRHPKGEARSFSSYGITHTMDEVFKAPDVVKHILKEEAGLPEVYVGTRETGACMEAFLRDNPNIRLVWTPDSQTRVNVSRYNSAAVSQMVINLRLAQYLTASATGGDQELQNLQRQASELQQRLVEIEAEGKEAEDSLAEAERRRSQVEADRKAIADAGAKYQRAVKDANTLVKVKEAELRRLEAQPDPLASESALRARISSLGREAAELAVQAAETVAELWQAMKQMAPLTLGIDEAHAMVAQLKRGSAQAAQRVRDCESTLRKVKEVADYDREALRRRKERAVEVTGEMTDELRAEMLAVPSSDTVAQLQEYIDTKQAEADSIVCGNTRVVDEHKQRCLKIAQIENRLREEHQAHDEAAEGIAKLREEWLPHLQHCVECINETFSKSFATIGCAGEVVLHEADDYDQFAIHIRVSFREGEDLHVLNEQRQSGGERSVSTMMYLVALTGVTITPFRVVDEINQGMDEFNERKVFHQLSAAAGGDGAPQTFLLTPKLLSGLDFNDHIHVHDIFNGPHVEKISSVRALDMLAGRTRITV